MLDQQILQLMHVHGGERFPMEERGHHDPADHDPERSWRKNARIFRCTGCEGEVVVLPPGRDEPVTERR